MRSRAAKNGGGTKVADAGKQCSACDGQRLNEIARNVRFRKQSIAELTAQSVASMRSMFAALKLQGRASDIARDVLAEINSRLSFLEEVGLGYLALDRSAPTLSGGEAQRIRLAAQLGSNLQGVCYILDEPTIGLHPRDNRILLDTLARLAAKGNSLLVVEHDEDTIRRADHVIDLGPGAGTRGGHVVAAGTAQELQRSPQSITGRLLANPLRHPIAERRTVNGRGPALTIESASLHNLRKQTFRVPLGSAGRRDRRFGIGQVDAGARRAARQSARGARPPPRREAALAGLSRASAAGSRSAACWKSTRRRSARRRARVPRRTSVSGMRFAACSRRRPRRGCAATRLRASPSIPPAGAAKAARGRVSAASR